MLFIFEVPCIRNQNFNPVTIRDFEHDLALIQPGHVPPVEIAGNEFVCEVVVKRKGKSNQFYLHEVNVRDDVVAALQDLYLGSRQPQPARPVPSVLIYKIKKINQFVSKISKTLDPNGEPAVLYQQVKNQYQEIEETSKEVYFQRGFTGKASPTQEEQEEANRQYDEVVKRYKDTPLWMKSPNGKPTNLTERQWVQVRTPNFKEWFGDWESLYKKNFLNSNPISFINYGEFQLNENEKLSERLHNFLSKETLFNPLFGKIVVNPRSIKDALYHSQNKKSGLIDSIKSVPDVIRHGIVLNYTTNWKNKRITGAVISAPINVYGKDCICSVVIRRSEDKHRFYMHSIVVRERLVGGAMENHPRENGIPPTDDIRSY